MVSFDILLEFREFLKNGHPLTNVISTKLTVLRKKAKAVSIVYEWDDGGGRKNVDS